jgi:Zn-dependent protease with chaperone function
LGVVGFAQESIPDADSAAVGIPVQQEMTGSSADSSLYPLSAERQEQLHAYSQFTDLWRFVSFFVGIGSLLLILFTGLSARFRSWAQFGRKKIFSYWIFVILILLTDYLINLPFSIYRSFFVEHDYGFSNQTFGQWFGEDLLNLGITALIAIIPMAFFYWLVGSFRRWWLWFSLGMFPVMVFFVVIAPVFISPLFNDYTKLTDKQLESRILSLADKAGIEGSDVFEVNASKQSSKVNAYVTGLFGTKRIVLYDTLIKHFTYDEIGFVMGHEMGHYVMNHVWWGLSIAIVFVALALWLTNQSIRSVIRKFSGRFGFDKLEDIASLPLVLVYASVILFVLQPITNGASRHMEHQSDIYGMDITGVSSDDAARAFDKLSAYNLSDPDPNPIIEFWFSSHPSLKKRIEFVRSYRPMPDPN